MKRLLSLLLGIAAICVLLAFSANKLQSTSGDSSAKVLNLYNWGDYIDPRLDNKISKGNGLPRQR